MANANDRHYSYPGRILPIWVRGGSGGGWGRAGRGGDIFIGNHLGGKGVIISEK